MRNILFVIFVIFAATPLLHAQESKYHLLPVRVVDGDTLPYINLSPVEVFDFRIFKTQREVRQNNRLIRNVKRVYPWAKLAGQKLVEYETVLSHVESDREKRQIMKEIEKQIHEEYGGELRKLTISQGKILIKLVDRETGNTSYNLVQDFRGMFVAFFYQSFARIFGYNLKINYEPEGEDRNIEVIVRMIENGVI
ncbi:MAG TPA: DUF4294 domain-containing protein [Bacteroidales bacterium]|nr:DUF4294 domain-containing protein [Bacteroidales bacterium]